MTNQSIETRIERTLQEVADRLPEHASVEPPVRPLATSKEDRRRRPWLLAAAAIVVLVAIGGVLVATQKGDESAVPVATNGAARPILTAAAEIASRQMELRLETTATDGCITLVIPEPFTSPRPVPACLADGVVAVGARSVADKTLVYGVAARGERVTGTIEEVATADVHQVPFHEGVAFLLVIDASLASGTVAIHDATNATIATGSFERGGPARPPRAMIGDSAIDFAYLQRGAVWVRTESGDDVRISDGTIDASDGYPFLLSDGHTVVYSVATRDQPFDAIVATDARDGSTRDLHLEGTALLSLSPDGTRIAATDIQDDSGAPSDLVVLRADNFTEVTRVTLGTGDTVGMIWSAAWDLANDGLLVKTRCCQSDPPLEQLWHVQLGSTAIAPVKVEVEDATWSFTDTASAPGTFPALRRAGSNVEAGVLRIDGSTATWEHRSNLTLQGDLWIDTRAAGDYLVGDATDLYDLDAAGNLTLLLRDVTYADGR